MTVKDNHKNSISQASGESRRKYKSPIAPKINPTQIWIICVFNEIADSFFKEILVNLETFHDYMAIVLLNVCTSIRDHPLRTHKQTLKIPVVTFLLLLDSLCMKTIWTLG